MQTITIISIVNVTVEFSGVTLLYFYGISKHTPKHSGAFMYADDKYIQKENLDNKRYAKLAKLGYILIVISWLVQVYILSLSPISNKPNENTTYCPNEEHWTQKGKHGPTDFGTGTKFYLN